MHAAGVVIGQKDVDEYVPLALGSDGSVDDTVYHDHTGRTGASENGFPGSSNPDCHPGCDQSGKASQV